MLDILIDCAGSGTGRPILNWKRVVQNMKLKAEIYHSRFIEAPFIYSHGTNLLLDILNGVNVDDYKSTSSIARYMKAEAYANSSVRNKFDPVYSQRSLHGYFVNSSSTPEYILNCTMQSPILGVNFNAGWDVWHDVTPMRILWHDSKELNLALWTTLKMPFTRMPPTRVFYALNVPLFVCKYIKYVEHCESMGTQPTKTEYIKDHIVYSWFDDLIRIWLTHMAIDMINSEWDQSQYYSDSSIITTVASFASAYPEVKQISRMAARQALSIGDICATKWFDTYSMSDWLKWLKANIAVPPYNAYTALQFISLMPYYKFILATMSFIGRRDIEIPAKTILYDIHMYKNRSVGSTLREGNLRFLVNKEIDALEKMARKIARPSY